MERHPCPIRLSHHRRPACRDVNKDHVLQILWPIWKTKTTTAKGLRARIATVLDYAASKDYRPREGNPAAWEGNLAFDLAKPSRIRPKRQHPALGYEEIGVFMVKLRQDPGMAARAFRVHDLNCGQILRGTFRPLV